MEWPNLKRRLVQPHINKARERTLVTFEIPLEQPSGFDVRERVLSCPDKHRSEAEIVLRVVAMFPLVQQASGSEDIRLQRFNFTVPPRHNLGEFIARMVHYLSNVAFEDRRSHLDDGVHSDMAARYFVAARILLDRVHGLTLTIQNAQRFIVAALITASKSLEDKTLGLHFFSLATDLPRQELIELEFTLVSLLNFSILIYPGEFSAKYRLMLGCERPWAEDALVTHVARVDFETLRRMV